MRHRPRRPAVLHPIGPMVAALSLLAATVGTTNAADPSVRMDPIPAPAPRVVGTGAAVPLGELGITSFHAWEYGDGSVEVVGEVLNNTASRQDQIELTVRWFDGADTEIGTPETGFVELDSVAPGALGSFAITVDQPPVGWQSYSVDISDHIPVTPDPNDFWISGGLNLVLGTSYVANGMRYYPGQLVNPNDFSLSWANVYLTSYDGSGEVVDVVISATNYLIPAGGSVPFLFETDADYGTGFKVASVKFVADGYDWEEVYVTSWANYYDDLRGSSFKEDIVWLSQEGITRGCRPLNYCPTAPVSRGQMASFLARALDLPASSTDYFTDDNGTTHEANINRVAKAGITTGCASGKYCPTADVTRGQMASFLARAFDLPASSTDYFTDDNGTTHEANINRVAKAGITTGCASGKYCPKADVTRGQMAAFLRRALE